MLVFSALGSFLIFSGSIALTIKRGLAIFVLDLIVMQGILPYVFLALLAGIFNVYHNGMFYYLIRH